MATPHGDGAERSPLMRYWRVVELSTCVNASKMRARCSAGIPIPVSRTSFGTGGTVVLVGEHVTSLALQDDGKIVLAGYFRESNFGGFGVKRLHAGGALDTTFRAGDGFPGVVTTAFSARYTARS